MPETLPLRCDLVIFRQAPVYAGCCPFCLGHSELPASQRIYQLFNRFRWLEPVQGHIQAFDDASGTVCPYPQCVISFGSVQDLRHHLQDIHCIKLAKAFKRRCSELTPQVDSVRVKRPRHANRLKPHADHNKLQSEASSPEMKPAEGFSILNGEMKYTFITCTAEAFPSSGSTRIIRKESGRESEKRVMDEQHSDFPGQEDILSMDPSACFPQENNYEKPCTSGPASVKSESTSSAPYFTSDGETAVDKTPETSVISNSPPCIDPCLLEMSDAIQPSPQSNDPDQTIAKKCNEEYEPLLAAWPGLPHNNTQMSLSTAHSNLTLERRKLELGLLLAHSTNVPSPGFQRSALPLSRTLPSYLLARPLPPPRLHRPHRHLCQSPSLPPGRASHRHLHAPYLHHRVANPRVQCGRSCRGLRGSWMAVQHRRREHGQPFCVSAERGHGWAAAGLFVGAGVAGDLVAAGATIMAAVGGWERVRDGFVGWAQKVRDDVGRLWESLFRDW